METFNNWWDVEKKNVILMVKDRIKNRFGEIGDDSDFKDFVPGFVLHEKPKIQERLLSNLGCGFCHHIPWYPKFKDIMKCFECPTYYCWTCAKLLALMRQKREGNPSPNLEEFEKGHIDCATCARKTRMHPINAEEREMFHGIIIKCRNSSCDYVDKLVNVQRHMQDCEDSQYKVGSVLNYLHEEMKRRRDRPREDDEEDEILELATPEDFLEAFDRKLMIQYPGTFEPKDGFEATKRGTDNSLPLVIKARKVDEPMGRSPSAYSTPEGSPPRSVRGPKTPPETPIVVRKLQSKWDEASKVAGVPDIRKELNKERDSLSRPSTSKQLSPWPEKDLNVDELRWSEDEDNFGEGAIASVDDSIPTIAQAARVKEKEGKLVEESLKKPTQKVRDYGVETDEEVEWEGESPARKSSTASIKSINRELPKSLTPAIVDKKEKIPIWQIRQDKSLSDKRRETLVHRRWQQRKRQLRGEMRGQQKRRLEVLDRFLSYQDQLL